MKFSLFRNDKTTAKDELLLLGFILACLAVGIALIITQPSFWLFDRIFFAGVGVAFVITGVMFIPGLIYRLMTNDKMK